MLEVAGSLDGPGILVLDWIEANKFDATFPENLSHVI